MTIATRTASTSWSGSLARGTGDLTSGSGALTGQQVTWAARTEEPNGLTSPEELAAAAHASCFSMALALRLGENGTPPGRLDTNAVVALSEVDGVPTIVSSDITVRAWVPGLDTAEFDRVVAEAAALCPVSRLFAGASIEVDAVLEDAEDVAESAEFEPASARG
jgi:osmotically inducible protein OsmC